MEPPNDEPNPDAADAVMPDSSTIPLQSVGDHQQTLGMGPPQPPRNPPTWVLLWQTQVGGCNSPQLVPQDAPLLVPAIIPASATNMNPTSNTAPVPSTISNLWHCDNTGNGGTPHSSTLSHMHNTSHEYTGASTHPVTFNLPLPDNIISPLGGWQTLSTYSTIPITQPIVPFNFSAQSSFW